jgi:hypothetical protein
MTTFSKEHVSEVSAMLHEEHRCVSVAGITNTFGVSGGDLLHQVVNANAQESYQATYCHVHVSTGSGSGEENQVKTTGKSSRRYFVR